MHHKLHRKAPLKSRRQELQQLRVLLVLHHSRVDEVFAQLRLEFSRDALFLHEAVQLVHPVAEDGALRVEVGEDGGEGADELTPHERTDDDEA
eukprot:1619794-Prymnesium_polylepis.1